MSKSFFQGLALIATAVANACHQAANGYSDCTQANPVPVPDPTPEPEAPKKPGRPKKEVVAAPTPEKTAEPKKPATPEPEPEPEPEAEKPAGMTLEQLQTLIKPLVEGGQGGDVKKEIAKFGVSKLSELAALPQHHTEFAKNIEALTI